MDKHIYKKDFTKIITDIKGEICTTQARTMQQVNSNLIMMYFRIGKILAEGSKYGNSFIANVATELKMEFPDLKGFSDRNLKRMKRFYIEYCEYGKVPQAVAQLPWGHNIVLFEKIKDKNIRENYARACVDNGWSRSVLEMQIENKYHLRVGASVNNFKEAFPPLDSNIIEQSFKDPYVFDFLMLKEGYKEKELERSMVEKIRDVLLELGNGWSFMGNQYKITVSNNDYFIDLLFYHTKLKCYVVVELKATKFEPEFVGKMNFYLSAIDNQIKSETDNPSIGLILCKDKDRITAQYSLDNFNRPIGISSFINESVLPTEDDLNLYIDIEE